MAEDRTLAMPGAWVKMPGEDEMRRLVPSGHPYDFGFITGMQRLVMAHLGIAPFFGALFQQIMFAPGALTRAEREMVAAVAAAAQDCHY
ncbi:MAG: carboxymuconolactone decarboxylase family protein [Dehalococcoidia bacterium]|nr:carboxymuconolactone decarboxylase family protein [Dehalococcoidia bacterium]